MASSACGQADSHGGTNVMTMATDKPVGQVMTWARVSTGLGLLACIGGWLYEKERDRRKGRTE